MSELPPAIASWRCLVWSALLALAIPTAYSLYTDQIWEDYFITFRFSKNLCEGKGLVYNPGQRVYGFTSPLGTLLPAWAYWVSGVRSYVPAIWLYRAMSLAAFAGACLLLVRSFDRQRFWAAPWFMAALFALDAKSVAFSSNGMETGFMLLFLAWTVFLYSRGHESSWLPRGLAWAGLMWTRPDGCIYIVGLGLADLFFGQTNLQRRLTSLLKSAFIAAAVYLPWFLWAWYYYKSPIPQTLKAKAPVDYAAFLSDKMHHLAWSYYQRAYLIFAPVYYHDFPGWPEWIGPLSCALALFASIYWVIPSRDRFGRGMSLCFAVLMGYAIAIELFFPWYIPPMTMVAVVVIVSALSYWVSTGLAPSPVRQVVAWSIMGALAGAATTLCAFTAVEMKVQQEEIEMNGRYRIGCWLHEHAQPGDQVYVESLGYIGYFSDAVMVDWPGLVSPQVVRLKRQVGSMYEMPAVLKTEWVVARGTEAKTLFGLPDFVAIYTPVAKFNVLENIAKRTLLLPGRGWLNFDSGYLVFERRDHQSRTLSSEPRSLGSGATP